MITRRFAALSLALLWMVVGCSSEEFGGFGIEVPAGEVRVTPQNPCTITSVFPGGMGERAGLRIGDVIVSVDQKPVLGLTHDEIVNNLLRGRVGTSSILGIQRGGRIQYLTVIRGKVVVR